ncbi:hypothetical protein ABFX02_08G183900 [Erythranthe guttata]
MIEPEIEIHEEAAAAAAAAEDEDEEEYVMLDLSSISNHIRIPPNAPYVLSGLDTLNPILIIDNNIKLIGEYKETFGTCLVFNESEVDPIDKECAGPSDPKQTPVKKVNPIASLDKILKFRLFMEAENRDVGADKQANNPS